ncbi:MAG: hypothetical protein KDA17_05175 [Candidatus Saccharibacteria bacterium]|nr:hypothetical protein [Candidatus Saccharibacteria bacterium]
MKPSEVLLAAKGLIDAPEKWGKGSYHTVDDGDKYCSIGAIAMAYGGSACQPKLLGLIPAYGYLSRAIEGNNVQLWNDADDRSWEEVMAAFDKAIALAQENGE